MRVRWLGWAGVELESGGERIVIDLLGDPDGVLAGSGLHGAMPAVVPPGGPRDVLAGLCTHLHRDHTDAGALAACLADGAPVLHPEPFGGDDHENLWLLTAEDELAAHGLRRRPVAYWETVQVGPFRISAVPAVDALGDPQVSFAVEAEGVRVIHLGDTMFHGYWWRAARRFGPFDAVLTPINGPVVCFPHCDPPSPFPASLDAEHAAVAARLLGARVAIPIHYDGFHVDGHYVTRPHELASFEEAASNEEYAVVLPALGGTVTLDSDRSPAIQGR